MTDELAAHLLDRDQASSWCADHDPTGRYVCARIRDHALDWHAGWNDAGGIQQWPARGVSAEAGGSAPDFSALADACEEFARDYRGRGVEVDKDLVFALWRALGVTSAGVHGPDTCEEIERECEDQRGEINQVLHLLAKRGFPVDKDRPLIESVKPALPPAPVPSVDGDLRERLVDAVLDVLAHGDVATQQEGSERLADVVLAVVRPVLERQAAEIADHSRAADIDEGTKSELAAENIELRAEVARLAAELARERAVYADKPEDRLWHAADRTWWRRAEDGRLVRGEAPLEVERLTRERDDALTALDDLERQRDAWWNQRAAERDRLAGLLRGMARRAGILRRERNLARSSRDQYRRNWDRCREANGTALQTISALKLDRVVLSGLLRGMARRASGQRRSKERLAMWAEARHPAIPADWEEQIRSAICDSVEARTGANYDRIVQRAQAPIRSWLAPVSSSDTTAETGGGQLS